MIWLGQKSATGMHLRCEASERVRERKSRININIENAINFDALLFFIIISKKRVLVLLFHSRELFFIGKKGKCL